MAVKIGTLGTRPHIARAILDFEEEARGPVQISCGFAFVAIKFLCKFFNMTLYFLLYAFLASTGSGLICVYLERSFTLELGVKVIITVASSYHWFSRLFYLRECKAEFHRRFPSVNF